MKAYMQRTATTQGTHLIRHAPALLRRALLGTAVVLAASAATAANHTIVLKSPQKTLYPVIDLKARPFVYAAKFVCGPQTVAATRIGQIVNYSAVEPGNYATALNLLSLTAAAAPIDVRASMDGVAFNPIVAQLPKSELFQTHTVTCDEILKGFGVSVSDEAYEGFLLIERWKPDLEVQSVYTYASREKFAAWRGVDEQLNVIENPEVGVVSIGGAGGLGLGASIDVERIQPINRNAVASN